MYRKLSFPLDASNEIIAISAAVLKLKDKLVNLVIANAFHANNLHRSCFSSADLVTKTAIKGVLSSVFILSSFRGAR